MHKKVHTSITWTHERWGQKISPSIHWSWFPPLLDMHLIVDDAAIPTYPINSFMHFLDLKFTMYFYPLLSILPFCLFSSLLSYLFHSLSWELSTNEFDSNIIHPPHISHWLFQCHIVKYTKLRLQKVAINWCSCCCSPMHQLSHSYSQIFIFPFPLKICTVLYCTAWHCIILYRLFNCTPFALQLLSLICTNQIISSSARIE